MLNIRNRVATVTSRHTLRNGTRREQQPSGCLNAFAESGWPLGLDFAVIATTRVLPPSGSCHLERTLSKAKGKSKDLRLSFRICAEQKCHYFRLAGDSLTVYLWRLETGKMWMSPPQDSDSAPMSTERGVHLDTRPHEGSSMETIT